MEHTNDGDMATMDSHSHGDMCSMSMLWNTSTRGMCIVFSSWRVSGPTSFYLSLATLFLLAALSEYLRYQIRMLDIRLITSNHLTSSLLCGGTSNYHRRKASVQHVHSTSSADLASSRNSPAKTSSLGGPSLATSALGVGLGDRRSPGFASADSSNVGSRSDDDAPLLPGGFHARPKKKHLKISERLIPSLPISNHAQLRRTLLFVVSFALSMFLMLVFMTYNSWLIGAILSGAGTGYYLFNRDLGLGQLDDKTPACH